MADGAVHPLLAGAVVAKIERAASAHRGRRWTRGRFTDRNALASHPCGVFHGEPFSVFAKLSVAADAVEQFTAELSGLALLGQRAPITTPTPVACGVVAVRAGSLLLLLEALPERSPQARTTSSAPLPVRW